ncbi:thiol reductant ABC exporter subunit CydD [Paucilactobacillus kaifaensis]|uniref:thiol reductant ABC exporter subunit CydD n=1 Tax=Paucilactobacillus kaifaensis TaxID=2559921 RepID=UPI0010F6B9F9|nr:thiol reductant ABC exporter subunit CydD [Paucilactobacillus kaifaensis]
MIDRRIFNLPGAKKIVGILGLLVFIQGFMILFQGKFLSESIVGLWKRQPLTSVTTTTILFAVAFLLRHTLTMLKNRIVAPFVNRTSQNLRSELMAKLFKIGPAATNSRGTGSVVTMAVDGIDQIQNYLQLVFIKVFDMMVIPWILLVYLFFIRWQESVFLLLIYPIIILFMIILGFAAQAKADQQYAGYQRLSNNFVDTLRGLPTLKQLGLSKQYAKNVFTVSEDYRKQTLSVLTIAVLSTFALDFFTTLSIAVVAVFLGLGLIKGSIALLPALIMLVLSPEYFLPIRNFANDYHATLNGKNAMTAIFEVLELPEIKNQNELVDMTTGWGPDDTLSFENINVSYQDVDRDPNQISDATLHDISFAVSGYQKIGVIGKSGSGKTTLIDTLSGFLTPQAGAGTIKVNQKTVPHLAQNSWKKNFLYIPQSPYLFHDTIENNIRFYTPNATSQQVQTAAKQAGLNEWLSELPDGLQTKIGEGNRGVSGGQAQRIALARAFLDQQRKILLFDEPTAHLDIETEAELKQTMMPIFANHLVFFATHRLHWLNQMDYVLVLDEGKLVQQGKPEELSKQSGAYAQLISEMGGEL